MTSQTGPPLRPASSLTRLVPQRPRVLPGEGSGLAFRRKRSPRPRTGPATRGQSPTGAGLSVPAPPLGMACPSYLLPILSPPPPPLEAHAPHSSQATYPPSVGLLSPPPPSSAGSSQRASRHLPIPLSSRLPAQPCLLAFSSVAPYQMPSLHLRPLSAGSLAHTHCYFFLFLMETRGKQPKSRALHFGLRQTGRGSERQALESWSGGPQGAGALNSDQPGPGLRKGPGFRVCLWGWTHLSTAWANSFNRRKPCLQT